MDDSTVFVVDDDEAMCDSLLTLARANGLKAEGFLSAESFLSDYVSCRPGCLVIDLRLPGMSGLDLQSALRSRGIWSPIIMISGNPEIRDVVQAIQHGAADFLEKPFSPELLVEKIRRAFERDLERRRVESAQQDDLARLEALTAREREVMDLLIRGCWGKQIALELGISYRTMEKFRSRLMQKMAVNSVAELVSKAVRLQILNPAKT
jgi:FixJ family two-component response regulator